MLARKLYMIASHQFGDAGDGALGEGSEEAYREWQRRQSLRERTARQQLKEREAKRELGRGRGAQPKEVKQKVKTLQPELATDAPDPAAMERWLRLAKIVDTPEAGLDYLAEGTLDAEEAAIWREQWPTYYQQVSDAVALKVAEKTERGEVIPYTKALALGTLLDVVADPTLDPAFIAAMQRPYTPPAHPAAPSRRAVSRAASLFDPGQET